MTDQRRIVIGQCHETGEVLAASERINQRQLGAGRRRTGQKPPQELMSQFDAAIQVSGVNSG